MHNKIPSFKSTRHLVPRPLVAALVGASLIASLPAFAADEAKPAPATDAAQPVVKSLQGITVHSRNREEKLQDVPLSESVVGGEELERFNAYDLSAISKRAANVSWNLGNQRTSSLSIRGIGKIGQTEAQDPSVGLVVDGVPWAYNALSSSFDFIDLESVEVVRGPQGTLLGKNTSMGAIILNRKSASFTPSVDYSLTFAQRNGLLGTVAATGPVIDDLLAYRATFNVSRQDGVLGNAVSTNSEGSFTNTSRVSGRLQFLLTPSDDFRAKLTAEFQPKSGEATNSGVVYTATPSTYSNGAPTQTASLNPDMGYILAHRSWFTQNQTVNPANWYNGGANGSSVEMDGGQPLTTGSHSGTAQLEWKLSNGSTLSSITGYKDYYFHAINDEGSPFDIARNSGGFLINYRQASEELRYAGSVGTLVDYQTGVFLIDVRNHAEYQVAYGNDAGAYYASNKQYAALDANAAGQLLMLNSLANISLDYNSPAGVQAIHNQSAAVFGQANWHLSDALTLTTGLRFTHENRTNVADSAVLSNGNGAALNPVTVNGVALGGFATTGTGALAASNNATQIALANSVAQQYFGVATYAGLSAAQQQQVAYAQQIRATKIGVLFPTTAAQPYSATQPSYVISPSYRLSENQTAYLSIQHGEKAGIAQFVNGVSAQVLPEKTDNFELGLKQSILNRTLTLNVAAFQTDVTNYQQSVRVVDPYTTALNVANGVTPSTAYTSATGNVPKVRVRGLEVDGEYSGLPFTTLRASGAYNNAYYVSFPNAAQPVENGYAGAPAYRDVSGQTLPGAPKWTGNIGADYRHPAWQDKELHASANVAFSSSFNSDVSLSSYAVVPKSTVVDLSVGLGRRDRGFDVSLLVKNAFNDSTPLARTWNSYTPGLPRTFGIQISGKI